MLDDSKNYRNVMSEIDPINENDIQTSGQVRYVIVKVNGNPWAYTAAVTSDPQLSLNEILRKKMAHMSTGIAANQTTFTAQEANTMKYNNNNLIDDTVNIPYEELSAQQITIANKLKDPATNPSAIPNLQAVQADNNTKLAKLRAAMAGGRRKYKRHSRSRRNKHKRGLKNMRHHSKTRRSRR